MESSSLWLSLAKILFFELFLVGFLVWAIIYSKKTFTSYARKRYSKLALARMNMIFKVVFTIILVGQFYCNTTPVIRDSIGLLRKGVSWSNTAYTKGKVTLSSSGGYRSIGSSVFFEDIDKPYYLMFGGAVREGSHYEIYYLPLSREVLKINELPNEPKNNHATRYTSEKHAGVNF
jgi:hypothetical protein